MGQDPSWAVETDPCPEAGLALHQNQRSPKSRRKAVLHLGGEVEADRVTGDEAAGSQNQGVPIN